MLECVGVCGDAWMRWMGLDVLVVLSEGLVGVLSEGLVVVL